MACDSTDQRQCSAESHLRDGDTAGIELLGVRNQKGFLEATEVEDGAMPWATIWTILWASYLGCSFIREHHGSLYPSKATKRPFAFQEQLLGPQIWKFGIYSVLILRKQCRRYRF